MQVRSPTIYFCTSNICKNKKRLLYVCNSYRYFVQRSTIEFLDVISQILRGNMVDTLGALLLLSIAESILAPCWTIQLKQENI